MEPSVSQQFTFKEVVESFLPIDQFPENERLVIGIDPGETTGLAAIHNGELIFSEEVRHSHKEVGKAAQEIQIAISLLTTVAEVDSFSIALEEYRVYAQKAKAHTHSDLFTSRLIGAIEFICEQRGWPVEKQTASRAKGFMTDKKLRHWGFWIKGRKHSRDAIRHAGCFILFKARRYKMKLQEEAK